MRHRSISAATVAGTTLVATNVDAGTTVSVTCTSGSPYSIGMDNGANVSGSQRRMKNGANFLNYDLYTDFRPHKCVDHDRQPLDAARPRVPASSAPAAGRLNPSTSMAACRRSGTAPPTGTYTDTVTMTITY